LQKIKKGELEKMGVYLHSGISIEKIDREQKLITDSHGEEHRYSRLIVATGSRPFVPRDVPMHMEGVFTLRERGDADRLKAFLNKTGLPLEKQHVLIVGGGLLGLELAAALRHINISVTIIQRASRLMERQLDSIASKLLAEEVIERGIPVYFDNEVDTIFENEDFHGLVATLKSGKIIGCTAAVYAIGTQPNIELLKAAGVSCGRGTMVNEYLQTSDEQIFAIGEIAEFRQRLFGITAAAEEQADILAKYMNGDLCSIYDGSILMNILKFDDFDLCSIGDITVPKNDPAYEEVIFTDLNQRYYKKCIIKNDRLVGAILLGDKSEFAEFRMLIEDRIELSEKRNELLRAQQQKEPVLGKLICSCNHVGVGNLTEKINGGCTDFNELCRMTGAGLGCGSCKPEVKEIMLSMNG
ncbi:MAG: FAD-dependent oxidoreductase, partial [Bacteroidota bacterium]